MEKPKLKLMENILDDWSEMHKIITEEWIKQGKPDIVSLWGGEYIFKDLHDNLSRECNRQLWENGYLTLDENLPVPEWATSERTFSDLI